MPNTKPWASTLWEHLSVKCPFYGVTLPFPNPIALYRAQSNFNIIILDSRVAYRFVGSLYLE